MEFLQGGEFNAENPLRKPTFPQDAFKCMCYLSLEIVFPPHFIYPQIIGYKQTMTPRTFFKITILFLMYKCIACTLSDLSHTKNRCCTPTIELCYSPVWVRSGGVDPTAGQHESEGCEFESFIFVYKRNRKRRPENSRLGSKLSNRPGRGKVLFKGNSPGQTIQ